MSKIPDRPIPSPELIAGDIAKPLLSWLRDYTRSVLFFINDMRNLQNAGKQSILQLDVLTAEPLVPSDGMIVYADGTSWDPGTGEGFYGYESGVWVKL